MDEVRKALEELIAEFGQHPVEINAGLCADFAGAFVTSSGDGAEIVGIEDMFEEARQGSARIAGASPPPGTDWDLLDALDVSGALGHSWIALGGRHYDAEAVDGVVNPFDLPCIRHGLHELVEIKHPDMLKQLEEDHPWWSATRRLREEREPFLGGAHLSRKP